MKKQYKLLHLSLIPALLACFLPIFRRLTR
jgi:hypothetical protein